MKRGCPADKQCHLLAVVCIAACRVPRVAEVGRWPLENIPCHHANEVGKFGHGQVVRFVLKRSF